MNSKTNEELAAKYGTVTHEGKEYTLTSIADYSNRLFTGWWGDAQEGEEYTAEFSAPAIDDEGNKYRVYWQFDAVKGEEPEDNGNWPWYDDNITRVAEE